MYQNMCVNISMLLLFRKTNSNTASASKSTLYYLEVQEDIRVLMNPAPTSITPLNLKRILDEVTLEKSYK